MILRCLDILASRKGFVLTVVDQRPPLSCLAPPEKCPDPAVPSSSSCFSSDFVWVSDIFECNTCCSESEQNAKLPWLISSGRCQNHDTRSTYLSRTSRPLSSRCSSPVPSILSIRFELGALLRNHRLITVAVRKHPPVGSCWDAPVSQDVEAILLGGGTAGADLALSRRHLVQLRRQYDRAVVFSKQLDRSPKQTRIQELLTIESIRPTYQP